MRQATGLGGFDHHRDGGVVCHHVVDTACDKVGVGRFLGVVVLKVGDVFVILLQVVGADGGDLHTDQLALEALRGNVHRRALGPCHTQQRVVVGTAEGDLFFTL